MDEYCGFYYQILQWSRLIHSRLFSKGTVMYMPHLFESVDWHEMGAMIIQPLSFDLNEFLLFPPYIQHRHETWLLLEYTHHNCNTISLSHRNVSSILQSNCCRSFHQMPSPSPSLVERWSAPAQKVLDWMDECFENSKVMHYGIKILGPLLLIALLGLISMVVYVYFG